MVRCPKCGKMNQDSSRFCNQCGAILPQTRIRCPQCGAMNPIGNVFCSKCNARLLPTEMQLPKNPKPAEEPPVGVKGISLPTLPKAREGGLEPGELPDWLLELTEQSLGKPAETGDTAESAAADQFPDWLSSLADTVDQGPHETPDTFAKSKSPVESAPAFSEFPDWLSDLTGEASAPEEPIPQAGDTGAPSDWLAGLLEDAETAGPVEIEAPSAVEEEPVLEELPDWLSDLTPEEPAAAPSEDIYTMAPPPSPWEAAMPASDLAAQPAAELPDWLLAGAVPTSPAEAPAPRPVPQWLLKNVEEPMPGQGAKDTSGAGQLPAWLLQGAEPGTMAAVSRAPAPSYPEPAKVQERAQPTAKAAPTPFPVPAETAPVTGEPDWLQGLYEEQVEPQAAVSAEEPAPEVAPQAGEPDWLLGIYEEEGEPQAGAPFAEPAAEAASEEATPDWLLGIYGEEETQPQAVSFTTEPEEKAEETGMPDWLAGIYSEEETEAQATPAAEAEKAAPGVPDWLAGIYSAEEAEPLASVFTTEPEEESAPETAVPDWLAGIITEGPLPVEPQAPPEGAEAAPEMGVPDWIAGLEPVAPPPEEKRPSPFAASSAIFTAAAPEEAQAGPSAVPEWLKGVTPADQELAFKPAQPVFVPGEGEPGELEEYEEPLREGGDIPDWLKGLAPVAASQVEEEATFYERVAEDESLVRAEVPSWLQELRPPGTGPLPPLPEVMVPGAEIPLPQEGGLVRAEIPDWVQQLRPVPSAEGEAGEKRVLEPAETEGPLAGLRGVLPPGAVIDMPADFQPAPPSTFPEAIISQAQLWQKLLEQPRSVQRPVAQFRARSGSGQLAMRLIVTTILLAVTVLGLLGGGAPLSQALSHPHIEQFSKTIDTLEAGDTVIVAAEYGPAEAGEMAAIAQAVMRHLADRNVHVMMVSTLPEGAGIVQSLLEPLALANRLPDGQAAYLPGSASGVAQFLAEPSEAKMIVVLAGRSERLRWWVEQNNATQALPMLIGVNAVTTPLVMPYLETSAVGGWVAGLPDVAAYQEFRGLSSNVLKSQLDALMLAHWAALVLLFFGLFYCLALGKKGAV
ncbi:MAG: zinc-ribbon domain-containing protein [Anaerolineae bacterium]